MLKQERDMSACASDVEGELLGGQHRSQLYSCRAGSKGQPRWALAHHAIGLLYVSIIVRYVVARQSAASEAGSSALLAFS